MAHELDTNTATGKAAMAYVGAKPWHGLGAEMEEGASIQEWVKAAGLYWSVERAPVQYQNGELHTISDKHVLYRSDTGAHLGIVSDAYKIVQPVEVLEFFRELVETSDFQIETAGSLFGGKKIWALAKMNRVEDVAPGDKVGGYLLLSTSFDGSLATTAQFTSIRVVCNNTLRMALHDGESSKTAMKIPHSTKFNEASVKAALGVGHKRFDTFISEGRKLAEQMITDNQAEEVVKLLLKGTGRFGADIEKTRPYRTIMDLYNGGAIGADLEASQGTSWGLLNAITQYVDHESSSKLTDSRIESAWFGQGGKLKDAAFETLLNADFKSATV